MGDGSHFIYIIVSGFRGLFIYIYYIKGRSNFFIHIVVRGGGGLLI
jgi:hypothetical protein